MVAIKKPTHSGIQIDHHIPPPGPHGHTVYPWHIMEPNDSFLVPSSKVENATASAKSHGHRVVTKQENKTHHRVWLIEKHIGPLPITTQQQELNS